MMTELDQVRLCAIAMELDFHEVDMNEPQHTIRIKNKTSSDDSYWPITNDVQAMALIKRFMLKTDAFVGSAELSIAVDGGHNRSFSDASLNHAIVMCVASLKATELKVYKEDQNV